jgi:DUF1680 family protein
MRPRTFSRRQFTKWSTAAAGGLVWGAPGTSWGTTRAPGAVLPLAEFTYGDVSLDSELHEAQLANTYEVLMNLSEDSLLKPFRQMAGQAAPGADLGGWYNYNPDYDRLKGDDAFAPGATFGQWISALARHYAIKGLPETREKILRLNRLYAKTISEDFYDKNRFPAYCYDKLVLGLIDSQRYVGDPDAFPVLEQTTRAALPHMPGKAIDREIDWRAGKDYSYRWDESYTISENLFLAYQRGAGSRYRDIAIQYLDDGTWFDPLSRGENVLGGKHAYSYVNSLSSAMQAYLTLGSAKHLRAAQNGFAMLGAQSFVTGGWGPDETLEAVGSGAVNASLTNTHNSFETPCGAYAHFKVSRYLLRATGDSRYGDSMERMMYNTVLGAKPMQSDGRALYYADYNFSGRKVYSDHRFPCCSGTLPQVAADYRINTYFYDRLGLYVNLYIPSTINWVNQGAHVTLTQGGGYPFEDSVTFAIKVSRPTEFALRLRIPEWTHDALIAINGKPLGGRVEPGTFAEVSRQWRSGDRVELELPRSLRLEAVDARHAETAALLCGPLVLFALAGDDGAPELTRRQLLAAVQSGKRTWTVRGVRGPTTLVPYVAIDEESYSTYLRLT